MIEAVIINWPVNVQKFIQLGKPNLKSDTETYSQTLKHYTKNEVFHYGKLHFLCSESFIYLNAINHKHTLLQGLHYFPELSG